MCLNKSFMYIQFFLFSVWCKFFMLCENFVSHFCTFVFCSIQRFFYFKKVFMYLFCYKYVIKFYLFKKILNLYKKIFNLLIYIFKLTLTKL